MGFDTQRGLVAPLVQHGPVFEWRQGSTTPSGLDRVENREGLHEHPETLRFAATNQRFGGYPPDATIGHAA